MKSKNKQNREKYKGIWVDFHDQELFRAENNPDYPHCFWQKLLSPEEAEEYVEVYGWKIVE